MLDRHPKRPLVPPTTAAGVRLITDTAAITGDAAHRGAAGGRNQPGACGEQPSSPYRHRPELSAAARAHSCDLASARANLAYLLRRAHAGRASVLQQPALGMAERKHRGRPRPIPLRSSRCGWMSRPMAGTAATSDPDRARGRRRLLLPADDQPATTTIGQRIFRAAHLSHHVLFILVIAWWARTEWEADTLVCAGAVAKARPCHPLWPGAHAALARPAHAIRVLARASLRGGRAVAGAHCRARDGHQYAGQGLNPVVRFFVGVVAVPIVTARGRVAWSGPIVAARAAVVTAGATRVVGPRRRGVITARAAGVVGRSLRRGRHHGGGHVHRRAGRCGAGPSARRGPRRRRAGRHGAGRHHGGGRVYHRAGRCGGDRHHGGGPRPRHRAGHYGAGRRHGGGRAPHRAGRHGAGRRHGGGRAHHRAGRYGGAVVTARAAGIIGPVVTARAIVTAGAAVVIGPVVAARAHRRRRGPRRLGRAGRHGGGRGRQCPIITAGPSSRRGHGRQAGRDRQGGGHGLFRLSLAAWGRAII